MLRTRLAAGAFLVATLTILALAGYSCTLRRHAAAVQEELSAQAAENAGLRKAVEAKPKEVFRLVEKLVPGPVREIIKEKKVEPLVSTVVETQTEYVNVPCPAAGAATSVPVGVDLKGWFLLTTTPKGVVHWGGELKATLTPGGEVVFDESNSNVELRVSTEIEDAIAFKQKYGRWTKRHFKVACPGFGLTYGLVHGKVDVGPTCSASFVW